MSTVPVTRRKLASNGTGSAGRRRLAAGEQMIVRMTWLHGPVAALLALMPAVAAAEPSTKGTLRFVGQGGQVASLVVPEGGLVLGYRRYPPLLKGDGADVSGVLIQRASDRAAVAGVAVINAPGHPTAVGVPLIGESSPRLAAGRYWVTMLGSGRSDVTLDVENSRRDVLVPARGPATPITRTVGGKGASPHVWDEGLGRLNGREFVMAGTGGGGRGQQVGYANACVSASPAEPSCLSGGASLVTPSLDGSAIWSSRIYEPGVLKPGTYRASGAAVGGPRGSAMGHIAVVIAPR